MILWGQFLHLLKSKKNIKILHDDWCLWLVVTFMRPATNFCKMCGWLYALPPHLYLIHWFPPTPHPSFFGVVFHSHLWMQPPPRVSQWAPVKTQDTGPVAEVHITGMISVSPDLFGSCYLPFVAKTPIYPKHTPCLLKAVSQGYLRCYLPSLSPNFAPNKI